MSKQDSRQLFLIRCPKCRKKLTVSIPKNIINFQFFSENLDQTCKHCSHQFETRCEIRLVPHNKKH